MERSTLARTTPTRRSGAGWRRAALAALLCGGAGVALWAWTAQAPGRAQAPAFRLGTIDRGAISASVAATGTVNPVTTVLVGSQLSGLVVEVLADYNSVVTRGQVVARLDATQIRSRVETAAAELAIARAAVDTAVSREAQLAATRLRNEAQLADATAQRARAAAQEADARRALARQIDLQARGVSTPVAADAAKLAVETAGAGLASADAQIAAARAELEVNAANLQSARAERDSAAAQVQAREASLRAAGIDLERTEIRSPVDGVVVQRSVELGQTVAASLSAPVLFTVAQDLSEVHIHANVDESDVGRIRPGQEASFTVNAYPGRSFAGRVRQVRLGSQTVQNVVIYTAVVAVPNRDGALLPGMTANLRVLTENREDALRVPNAALRWRPPAGLNVEVARGADGASARPEPPAAAPGPGLRGESLLSALEAELEPTPEQAAALRAVLADARARRGVGGGGGGGGSAVGARPDGAEDRGARSERAEAARRRLAEEIGAVLDDGRRAKLRAFLERRAGGAGASAAGQPARLYLPGPGDGVRAVAVRIGVSDGTTTEIVSGAVPGLLEPGAQVIVGGGPAPVPAAGAARGPRMF